MPPINEPEWLTRKKRVGPLLDAAGWTRFRGDRDHRVAGRTEEEGTSNGPADYALWVDSRIAGVVEAKRPWVGPQNVLIQADRKGQRSPWKLSPTSGRPLAYRWR